jgi:hypothetical protein
MAERRMLSITASSALPSVFGACAPNVDPLARGYAAWPTGKWWWPGALADSAEVQRTRLLGGRVLLITTELLGEVIPLFHHELARAEAAEYGNAAQELVTFLDTEGPTVLGDARKALGLAPKAMAAIRETLEPRGALLSEDIELPAKNGGHIHTSRLYRPDHLVPFSSESAAVAHAALLQAAIRAAVIAKRREIEKWFAWPAADALDTLIARGAIQVVGAHLAA